MILKSEAKEAGIEDVSPHDLRRTFITSRCEGPAMLSCSRQLGAAVFRSEQRGAVRRITGGKGKTAAKSLALSSREARRN